MAAASISQESFPVGYHKPQENFYNVNPSRDAYGQTPSLASALLSITEKISTSALNIRTNDFRKSTKSHNAPSSLNIDLSNPWVMMLMFGIMVLMGWMMYSGSGEGSEGREDYEGERSAAMEEEEDEDCGTIRLIYDHGVLVGTVDVLPLSSKSRKSNSHRNGQDGEGRGSNAGHTSRMGRDRRRGGWRWRILLAILHAVRPSVTWLCL